METVFSTADLLGQIYGKGAPRTLGVISKNLRMTTEQSYKHRLQREFGIYLPEELEEPGIYKKLYEPFEMNRNDPSFPRTFFISTLDDSSKNLIPQILLLNQKLRVGDELIRNIVSVNDPHLLSTALDQIQSSEKRILISDETLLETIRHCNADTMVTLMDYNEAGNHLAFKNPNLLIETVKDCNSVGLVEFIISRQGRFVFPYLQAVDLAIELKKYNIVSVLAATGKIGLDATLISAVERNDIEAVKALLVDSHLFTTNALVTALKPPARRRSSHKEIVGILLDDGRADLMNSKILELLKVKNDVTKMVEDEGIIKEWDLKAIHRAPRQMIIEFLDDDDVGSIYELKLRMADQLQEPILSRCLHFNNPTTCGST